MPANLAIMYRKLFCQCEITVCSCNLPREDKMPVVSGSPRFSVRVINSDFLKMKMVEWDLNFSK